MAKDIARPRILAALILAATVIPSAAPGASIKFSDFTIASPLTDDDGAVATNISGVSCLPPASGKYVCLVIDDEGRLAQAATIEGLTLKGGGKIRLIGKSPPPGIIGKPPDVEHCLEKAKFKDMDGEAVAHDGKFFYVVGSHGCSRNSDKFRASIFILARISDEAVLQAAGSDPETVDEKGPVATTYRLSEALLAAPTVKAFFAQNLMTGNGLNIEGLAVADGKLYAGLRAPVIGSKGYLVAVDVDRLFDPARPITQQDVREIDLDLGGRGIRDLAVLSDGRLLVLSGPAQSQAVSFALHIADPKDKSARLIAELTDFPPDWKAEAVHVLAQEPTTLDLVIMFDHPDNGAPRKYVVDLN